MQTARSGREVWVAAVLLVAGVVLVALAPVVAPAPPAGPAALEECEYVQLAIYGTDVESTDRSAERHGSLTETQQSVFEVARAADGGFVRFQNRTRMAAADSLPHYVILNGTYYRAHGVLVDCFDRPWYVGLVEPSGYVLLGLGTLVGGRVVWRRMTY